MELELMELKGGSNETCAKYAEDNACCDQLRILVACR